MKAHDWQLYDVWDGCEFYQCKNCAAATTGEWLTGIVEIKQPCPISESRRDN